MPAGSVGATAGIPVLLMGIICEAGKLKAADVYRVKRQAREALLMDIQGLDYIAFGAESLTVAKILRPQFIKRMVAEVSECVRYGDRTLPHFGTGP